jgi:hypothetical protein
MARVERLPIFLASPGDVLKERRYVQEVTKILNWNFERFILAF